MSDIKTSLQNSPEPERSLGLALIDFYENMKRLESDPQRGGKQATLIVMAIADIQKIFIKEN